MNNLCTKCIHKQLCKFKEDFEKIDSEINFKLKDLLEANKQIFFSVKLECQFFKEELSTLQPTKLPRDYSITDISYDPCRDCLNKPDFTKGPIIGDRACDWCQHNPYKLTCTTAK